MPLYDYKCYNTECNYVFETVHGIKDDKLKVCPKCLEPKLDIVISGGTGFILKGDGWPGQEIKRADEDEDLRYASSYARKLKGSGEVKMEDHLSYKDVKNLMDKPGVQM